MSFKESYLEIVDFHLVPQECSQAYTEMDDEGIAEFAEEMADLGWHPSEFLRIWIHTHPKMGADPSGTDLNTFRDVFANTDWGLMYILSKTNKETATLKFNVPGVGILTAPIEIKHPTEAEIFAAIKDGLVTQEDFVHWEAEHKKYVRTRTYSTGYQTGHTGNTARQGNVVTTFSKGNASRTTPDGATVFATKQGCTTGCNNKKPVWTWRCVDCKRRYCNGCMKRWHCPECLPKVNQHQREFGDDGYYDHYDDWGGWNPSGQHNQGHKKTGFLEEGTSTTVSRTKEGELCDSGNACIGESKGTEKCKVWLCKGSCERWLCLRCMPRQKCVICEDAEAEARRQKWKEEDDAKKNQPKQTGFIEDDDDKNSKERIGLLENGDDDPIRLIPVIEGDDETAEITIPITTEENTNGQSGDHGSGTDDGDGFFAPEDIYDLDNDELADYIDLISTEDLADEDFCSVLSDIIREFPGQPKDQQVRLARFYLD